MKNFFLLLLSVCLINPLSGQSDSIINEDDIAVITGEEDEIADTVIFGDRVIISEPKDKTRVTLGQNEILIIEENGDTTRIKLGKRGISIIEGEDGTTINIIEMEIGRAHV